MRYEDWVVGFAFTKRGKCMTRKVLSGPRNVAIVGPYSSGKTSLLESLLYVTDAVSRKGRVDDRNTVGDASPEARDRTLSAEINAASTEYGGICFIAVAT